MVVIILGVGSITFMLVSGLDFVSRDTSRIFWGGDEWIATLRG
jgi:hypothetical protein